MASAIRQLFTALIGATLLAALAACSPLKTLNALTPDDTFDKTEGIAYGSDPRQKLDVYTPKQHVANAPVVVFFYGGSWNSGSRSDYSFVGEALASRGIVVVLADYRLYPQVRYPLFLDDSASAVAWAHAHIGEFSGDPKRLFVMGHSSGAYNAAMLALEPKLLGAQGMSPKDLSGWIGLAGPYDFLPIENPQVRPVFFLAELAAAVAADQSGAAWFATGITDGGHRGQTGRPDAQYRRPGEQAAGGGRAGAGSLLLAHRPRHAGSDAVAADARFGAGAGGNQRVRQNRAGSVSAAAEPAIVALQIPGNHPERHAAQHHEQQESYPQPVVAQTLQRPGEWQQQQHRQ